MQSSGKTKSFLSIDNFLYFWKKSIKIRVFPFMQISFEGVFPMGLLSSKREVKIIQIFFQMLIRQYIVV